MRIGVVNPIRLGLEIPVTKLFREGLTMSEKVRFIVLLRRESETEALFFDNFDALMNEHRVLFCSEMDLSGYHAKVVRIPGESSQAWKTGARRQPFWFPASDVAAAFEYDRSNPPAGFVVD